MPNTNFGPMQQLPAIAANFAKSLTDACEILRTQKKQTETGFKTVEYKYWTVNCRYWDATTSQQIYQERVNGALFKGKGIINVALPLYRPEALNPDIYTATLLDLELSDVLKITSTATGEIFRVQVVSKTQGGSFPFSWTVLGARD